MTNEMTIEELIEEFEELGDWADQCEVLIDMGKEMSPMDDALKLEDTKVHGCQSNVWMVAEFKDTRIELIADSDAMIVRGLLTVILMLYSGRTAEEILAVDVHSVFDRLGLNRHLSIARKNGLSGMVSRVRQIAVNSLM
jgi:cysteine desulfuration protein SufE